MYIEGYHAMERTYSGEGQDWRAMKSKDPSASSCKELSMRRRLQLGALHLDELNEMKRWRRPLFSVEEPAVLTNQRAFEQKESPPVPS